MQQSTLVGFDDDVRVRHERGVDADADEQHAEQQRSDDGTLEAEPKDAAGHGQTRQIRMAAAFDLGVEGGIDQQRRNELEHHQQDGLGAAVLRQPQIQRRWQRGPVRTQERHGAEQRRRGRRYNHKVHLQNRTDSFTKFSKVTLV